MICFLMEPVAESCKVMVVTVWVTVLLDITVPGAGAIGVKPVLAVVVGGGGALSVSPLGRPLFSKAC